MTRDHDTRMNRVAAKVLFGVHACVLLTRIETSLRREPLPALCAKLGVGLEDPPGEPGRAVAWGDVHRVAARTRRVFGLLPFDDTCLRRSLVVGAFLRDAHPHLVIGVRRDEEGTILAHAWLVVDGRTIDPSAADFVTFDLT